MIICILKIVTMMRAKKKTRKIAAYLLVLH